MRKNLLLCCLLYCVLFGVLLPSQAQTLNETSGTGSGVSITSGDHNTAYGDSTLSNLTSGSQNTAVGYQAGRSNTTSEDVFVGYQAGYSNTTGFDNTFIGHQAGYSNTTGGDNTFIGTESGEYNTTGYDNTYIGEESGTLTTTGYENTFIGEDAGYDCTTCYKNVMIGNEAGISLSTGYRNTAVGSESGSDLLASHHNSFIGDSAGIDVGRGIYNTFIGAAAGVATEYADFNTFVGAMSGWDNNRTNSLVDANRNTYVGYISGASNREGEDNAGFGAFSGYVRINSTVAGTSGFTKWSNTALTTNTSRTTYIGSQAIAANNDVMVMGYYAWNGAQYSLIIGNESLQYGDGAIGMGHQTDMAAAADYAVGIGYQADIDNLDAVGFGNAVSVQGDYGIALGSGSGIASTMGNSIGVGYGTNIATENTIVLGNETTIVVAGPVNWSSTSDGRFKTNIQENIPGRSFINGLRPVTYNFNLAKMVGECQAEGLEEAGKNKENIQYTGFIAQEVEALAQELGYDFSGVKTPLQEGDSYGIRYAEFVAPLVKAMQEMNAEAEQLTAQNEQRQELIQKYQKLVGLLEVRIQQLEQERIFSQQAIITKN